ncbi:MAG: hypothetical protein P4L84_12895, partial [Isosphaeraceae bacterium]|nr:hypothetical protein [Isosphaeraceae bacterium]
MSAAWRCLDGSTGGSRLPARGSSHGWERSAARPLGVAIFLLLVAGCRTAGKPPLQQEPAPTIPPVATGPIKGTPSAPAPIHPPVPLVDSEIKP